MPALQSLPVAIPVTDAILEGDLTFPALARGLVVFAHGSGSSRFSSRNRHVAAVLSEAGFCTLLFDLLTASEEERDIERGQMRFDIDLLSERLVEVTDWLERDSHTRELRVGYFGASTGAGAALVAAAARPRRVRAVVSRGGRPDLAGKALTKVEAPTLLVVGGADEPVIRLNERAYEVIQAPCALEIVPGASHLFEEPGALDHVARLALDWFQRYL